MRRMAIFIMTLIMAVSALPGARAEADWLTLPAGIEWGASQEAVAAAEGADLSFAAFDSGAVALGRSASALGVPAELMYIFIDGKLVMRSFAFDPKDIPAERVAESLTSLCGAPEALSPERFRAMFWVLTGSGAALDAAIDTDIFKSSRAFSGPSGSCVVMMGDAANTSVSIVAEEMLKALQAEAAATPRQAYDETLAGEVLLEVTRAYLDADAWCAFMLETLDWRRLEQLRERFDRLTPLQTMSAADALGRVDALLSSGSAMPWSGAPLDRDACAEIFELCDTRAAEYAEYVDWLEFLNCHAAEMEAYGNRMQYDLLMLLHCDADILVMLYKLACLPHLPESRDSASGIPAQCLELMDGAAVLKAYLKDIQIDTPALLWHALSETKADRETWLAKVLATGVREDCAAWKAGQ